jgi:hypothetical protein
MCGGFTQTLTAVARATKLTLPPGRRKNAVRTAGYLLNESSTSTTPGPENRWPIATGIFERACRHLITDRMDIIGARW